MRSKSRGDAVIKRSRLSWVVLRPGVVIGSNAYGGSALLRMMAVFPWVSVPALMGKRIQTVALSELTHVVLHAVEARFPAYSDIDVVAPEPLTLQQLLDQLRTWLGVSPVSFSVAVPRLAVSFVSWVADLLGYLGWRSPLRSSAVQALQN